MKTKPYKNSGQIETTKNHENPEKPGVFEYKLIKDNVLQTKANIIVPKIKFEHNTAFV